MSPHEAGRRAGPARMLSAWGPVAAYLALITALSHQPSLPVPGGLPDWLAHGAEYAVLAGLVMRALALVGRNLTPAVGAMLITACAVAGVADEIHQSFVPGRDSEAKDVLADTTGAALAAGSGLLWSAWRSRRRTASSRVDVQLLGRRDCHLCDEARTVLARVLPEFDARLRVIDIDDDPDLSRRYGNQVPVVLLNGRKAFKYRVDPERLRRKLASCEQRRTT